MQNITIEPTNQSEVDCGEHGVSRTVWGYLYVEGVPRAVYYVQWTVGRAAENGANVDLLMGEWEDDSTPEQRVAVSLEYRVGPDGPEFRSLDPHERPHANSGLAAHNIPGRHVMGNPVAADAYAFMHAVFGQDARVAELVQASQV
ncbi:MAG: hypothetical protein H6719_11325 [Sandaracinaceae bacterium]|nr:hypothetical protein [Sandaracinaceae bacterium]